MAAGSSHSPITVTSPCSCLARCEGQPSQVKEEAGSRWLLAALPVQSLCACLCRSEGQRSHVSLEAGSRWLLAASTVQITLRLSGQE